MSSASRPNSSSSTTSLLHAVYWDIENCAPPSMSDAFQLVSQLRSQLKIERELHFRCFADITKIPQPTRVALQHGNVTLCDVPDRKPGASDRQILQELYRLVIQHQGEKLHVVIISGDADFCQVVADLRNKAGFLVSVVANDQARKELTASANHAYKWTNICAALKQIKNTANNATAGSAGAGSTASKKGKSNPNQSSSRGVLSAQSSPSSSKTSSASSASSDSSSSSYSMSSVVCGDCKQKFLTPTDVLLRFSRESKSMKPYLCPSCETPTNSNFPTHANNPSSARKAAANQQGKAAFASTSSPSSSSHSSSSSRSPDPRSLICFDCKKVFQQPSSLIQHVEDSEHKGLLCLLCERAFKSETALEAHVRDAHAPSSRANMNNKNLFTQKQQKSNTNTKSPNTKQTKQKTQNESDDDSDEGTNYCRDCGAQFDSDRAFFQHLKDTGHTDEEWKCSQCNRGFDFVANLAQHCKDTNHSFVFLWVCSHPKCSKYFRNEQHADKHTQETRHVVQCEALVDLQFT